LTTWKKCDTLWLQKYKNTNVLLEKQMAHVQAHIDKELLKTVKKVTIDKETSMNNFIEEALREKVEREKDKEQLKEIEDVTDKQ
jgi:Arc/MetJ family transcription regulator